MIRAGARIFCDPVSEETADYMGVVVQPDSRGNQIVTHVIWPSDYPPATALKINGRELYAMPLAYLEPTMRAMTAAEFAAKLPAGYGDGADLTSLSEEQILEREVDQILGSIPRDESDFFRKPDLFPIGLGKALMKFARDRGPGEGSAPPSPPL